MELLSHRGNIAGKNLKLENSVAYVNDAMQEGYVVVVDVWLIENEFYLCSSAPRVPIGTTRSRGYYLDSPFILSGGRVPQNDVSSSGDTC